MFSPSTVASSISSFNVADRLHAIFPISSSERSISATSLRQSLIRNVSQTISLTFTYFLTWLAYPIISLVFIIFRLQISSAESQTAVINAKDDLLSACHAAEHAATSAASFPRYLAVASNQQFADAVNGTMNGARAALILALTCMEAIINFLIDLYRSTFLCFLELVVVGGLGLLISAVQEVRYPYYKRYFTHRLARLPRSFSPP